MTDLTELQSVTQFSHRLYHAVSNPTTNVVLSPFNVTIGLGMVRAGTSGRAANQLDQLLDLPLDNPHSAFAGLTAALDGIDTANGLFVQRGLSIKQEFRSTLAAYFDNSLQAVDFGHPMTTNLINRWVADNTGHRIGRLFNQLPNTTRLVLASAIYFKGLWADTFKSAGPRPFTNAEGYRTNVPTMRLHADLRYAEGCCWQAVELPYRQAGLSMLVVASSGRRELDSMLDPAFLTEIDEGLVEDDVVLFLPKWDFHTDLNLLPPLSRLGFTDLVLDEISDEPMKIDQAVHRATITVDEEGTEAAAATGFAVRALSAPGPIDYRTVEVDRPFVFMIRHTLTGTPLFIGHVADPRQNR